MDGWVSEYQEFPSNFNYREKKIKGKKYRDSVASKFLLGWLLY